MSDKRPLLIDRYLTDATEVDVDCLADRNDTFVAGIMEHIEEAGIHSGDSACALPPHSLPPETVAELERQTRALAFALKVGGLMNVQYAIKDGDIYLLEVNPRASRTVPFVAKVIGIPVAKIAARVMAGEPLKSFFGLVPPVLHHVGVKEAVFPFARFPGVDTVLGPGDALDRRGHRTRPLVRDRLREEPDRRRPRACRAPGACSSRSRTPTRPASSTAARLLVDLGFKLVATSGTQRYLAENAVPAQKINKVAEGRPHIVDAIKNGDIQLVFNTSPRARRHSPTAVRCRVPPSCIKSRTTPLFPGAVAAAQGIKA